MQFRHFLRENIYIKRDDNPRSMAMDRPKRYYRISQDYCALRIYGMLNRKTVVSPAGFAYSDVSIFYILSERIF